MTSKNTTWFDGANSTLSYFSQYENAINILLKEIKDSKNIDSLALPTLFLIRHSVELGLKFNIKYFSKYSGIRNGLKAINSSHKLENLFDSFKEQINGFMNEAECSKDDPLRMKISEQIQKSKHCLDILIQTDNNGVSFRYPHDKKGNRTLNKDLNFDFAEFIESLEPLLTLLWHSTAVLAPLVDYHEEMEAHWKELESSLYNFE